MVRQAGSIDKLRTGLNPPKADFADAQPAAYGFVEQDSQNLKML
jgi:hypothetical protein